MDVFAIHREVGPFYTLESHQERDAREMASTASRHLCLLTAVCSLAWASTLRSLFSSDLVCPLQKC